MPANAVVVIPARWASTRFPGKPLHLLAGKPLIQHVWERCQRAKGIAEVIVATDDMRIAEAAFGFGAEVSLTSPKHRSGTDRCAEVAKRLRGMSHVINVQGDEPLIDPKLVSRLAAALKVDRKIGMITAAHPFGRGDDVTNPNLVKVVLDRNSDALYFSRSVIPNVDRTPDTPSRTASPRHFRHLGIYGYSTRFLLEFVKWKPGTLEQIEQLEQLRALENGAKIRVVLTKAGSIGVDTPSDAKAAERLLKPISNSSS
jgi:3-deoxy-manno-octulosonate cytidylyltransferase (CMP-KDO synthetase)